MTKVKITGKTKVSVKKRKMKFVGGKGDPAFISGTIKASVKKAKAKSNAES